MKMNDKTKDLLRKEFPVLNFSKDSEFLKKKIKFLILTFLTFT